MFVCFRGRIFALKLHARTTVPASRDLQENDIDVYVRPDTPATIVKKVSLKMMEINSVFNFNREGSIFRISCTYDIVGGKKDGGARSVFMLFFSTLGIV